MESYQLTHMFEFFIIRNEQVEGEEKVSSMDALILGGCSRTTKEKMMGGENWGPSTTLVSSKYAIDLFAKIKV